MTARRNIIHHVKYQNNQTAPSPDLHVGFKYIIRQHRTPDFRILYLHHPQWLCSKEDLWWLRALPNNNDNNNSAPRKLRGPLIWRVRSSLACLRRCARRPPAETEVRSRRDRGQKPRHHHRALHLFVRQNTCRPVQLRTHFWCCVGCRPGS